MKQLLEALGWDEIVSKNPYMWSFQRDGEQGRINIYFTTMTVQFQDGERYTIYRECTTEQLEQHITEFFT